ncbi:hypothetical protein BEL01nite_74620 [Bradyrhizobium elkanii]|nr:hypothetical protein BEL01nite_74620 [Bradyrhizobium elkanii]
MAASDNDIEDGSEAVRPRFMPCGNVLPSDAGSDVEWPQRPSEPGYFGFLAGSAAGLVTPQGSYFSLGSGIRSSAAL